MVVKNQKQTTSEPFSNRKNTLGFFRLFTLKSDPIDATANPIPDHIPNHIPNSIPNPIPIIK